MASIILALGTFIVIDGETRLVTAVKAGSKFRPAVVTLLASDSFYRKVTTIEIEGMARYATSSEVQNYILAAQHESETVTVAC